MPAAGQDLPALVHPDLMELASEERLDQQALVVSQAEVFPEAIMDHMVSVATAEIYMAEITSVTLMASLESLEMAMAITAPRALVMVPITAHRALVMVPPEVPLASTLLALAVSAVALE